MTTLLEISANDPSIWKKKGDGLSRLGVKKLPKNVLTR